MNRTPFAGAPHCVTAPLLAFCVLALIAPAEAGRGGNRNVPTRNTTRTNFSGGGNLNRNVNRNTNINRNANINRNRNVNINQNRNVNVNRNVDIDVHHRGYYGGCCYSGLGVGGAVAAGVATAVAVGAIVSTLPSNCTTIMANGVTYQNCGGTYYQPRYSGGNVQYVVVNHP